MDKKYKYLIVVFLIVSSLFAFGRITGNDFINFDDPRYITENPQVKSGINLQTIKWAFSTVCSGHWHPLTLLSHTLDWDVFGANAFGHHLINLLLHIGSALFLFFLLNRMTKNLWTSAFVAAFFALHPLRVESVAWAAERKDVLSMFFGMASIYAYAFYTDKSKLSHYFLCLILFALSLMSKPMLVTIPFILLLLDYWPLGRCQKSLFAPNENRYKIAGRLVWEKVPFFLLTIASSIITIWAQNKGGGFTFGEQLSFPIRVTNAFISYVSYLLKLFSPVDLAVFYPYEFSISLWEFLISGLIIIIITAFVIYYVKKLPFLFVGWLWYLGTLIPVIGLLQAGSQAMADRYTYLPSIGIAIMLAWGIPLLFQRLEIRKKILCLGTLGVLCMLAVSTWMQCGYWENSITLFAHTLHVTKDNYLAYYNLGCSLSEAGKIQEAIENFNRAISIKPDYINAYNNRAVAYHKLGHYQRAIEGYNQTILLNPDNDLAYYNVGLSYMELGQYQLAINDFNKAIRLNPNHARAYNNRGIAYHKLGQYQLAIDDFNKAISIIPYYVRAYNNRGNAYLSYGNKQLGCNDAQKACELGDCKLLEAAKSKGNCP